MAGTLGSGALDHDPAQGMGTPRCGQSHRSSQRAGASADVHHGEYRRLLGRIPPLVNGTGQHGAEQRAHLGAGQEIAGAGTSPATGCVEPCDGVVQHGVHEGVETHRTVVTDTASNGHAQRRGDSRAGGVHGRRRPQPPRVRNDSEPVTAASTWGTTPTTMVTATVMTSAALSDTGTLMAVVSPSGTSSTHITRATRA